MHSAAQVGKPLASKRNEQGDSHETISLGIQLLSGTGSGCLPSRDLSVNSSAVYTSSPDEPTREDRFTPGITRTHVVRMSLELGSFSDGVASTLGSNRSACASGGVQATAIEGVGPCRVVDVHDNDGYNTPTGPRLNTIRCAPPAFNIGRANPVSTRWALTYQAGRAAGMAPR